MKKFLDSILGSDIMVFLRGYSFIVEYWNCFCWNFFKLVVDEDILLGMDIFFLLNKISRG